jgi:hypothetical protein
MLAGWFDAVKVLESPMYRTLVIFCVTLAALGAWWWMRNVPTSGTRPMPPAEVPMVAPLRAARVETPATRAPARAPAASAPAAAGAPDYRTRFNDSRDYWELAQSLYVPARQGDAAAQ